MLTPASAPPQAALVDERLRSMAGQLGTPLYVYDLPALRSRVAELHSAFAGARATLLFATMANDRRRILELLATLDVGACVNSLPHLQLAREAGFRTDRIQFTSTGVTRHDMRELIRDRIVANLDSLCQLGEWCQLDGLTAGVRVNAASLGCGLRQDRMGIDASEVGEAEALAARLGATPIGLHVYLGTNFQRADAMVPSLERLFELAATVPSLKYVNLGGGIGIDYLHRDRPFDVNELGAAVARCARRLRDRTGADIDVIVEPGRGLVAGCGTFITSVTDIKTLHGQRFAAVDGSIAVFPRPLHHPDSLHRVRWVSADQRPEVSLRTTIVVGRTTFSRDILGTAALPEDLRLGDLIALDDAGAYSQSMASRFLGQPEPSVTYVEDS